MTNGDWIRDMSDAELAELFLENEGERLCCTDTPTRCRNDCTCMECMIAWLDKEHKDD